jgi:glycosyltransferase involved in cell wall biosynthesis
LRSDSIKGVIIFANNGFSFYERITMSLLCRLFRVPSLFFIRDGNFKNALSSPSFSLPFVKILLKIPYYIGSQGTGWSQFYSSLEVDEKKIILVRNWMPFGYSVTKIKKEVNKDESITFVYVGWLIKEKGINEILDAIASLSSLYTFKFIFVGGGDLEEMVSARIKDASLYSNVISMGWQEKIEVKKILDISHVFVLPSYAEGFPNSLLEAMSLGLPAICSDVGGISDSLHNDINGYLIPPRNTKSLELAMEKYLVNTELIGIHSQAALTIVAKNHDWEDNCKKLFETFNDK